jgi:hypothetical protein
MTKNPHSKVAKKAKFVKHLPFEVAKTISEAKFIAEDLAEANRYNYRGTAILAGDSEVRVGETIYLDNLDQNMSGYWTVLAISHLFGSGNVTYQLEVLVGADSLGDSANPNVGKNSGKRDFEAELSNQSLKPKGPKLNNYTIGVNNGRTDLGVKATKSSKNIPGTNSRPLATKYTPNIYKNEVPDFSQVARQVTWTAK